jgi:hypothetical protein
MKTSSSSSFGPIAIAHSAHRSCIALDHQDAEVAAPSPAASAAASIALSLGGCLKV